MRKRIVLILLLVAVCLLSACEMRTVDQMYCLPKRPKAYDDLQSVIDSAMEGLEYCAPRAGENQQTVQMADLDGDGQREYLLFARSEGEKPLRILIFAQTERSYTLVDTVACNGSNFDMVEYAQMDGSGGMEILVGCQLNEQVPRSLNAYSFGKDGAELLLTTHCTRFLTCDLNRDNCTDLFLVTSDEENDDRAVASLYSMADGSLEPFKDANLSVDTSCLRRVTIGALGDGTPAVFVGSILGEAATLTDVFVLQGDTLTNLSASVPGGTQVQVLGGYPLYAEDMDSDGIPELPMLMPMKVPAWDSSMYEPYLIRWYCLSADGTRTDKAYTYHCITGGWYLRLQPQWLDRLVISQAGYDCRFYMWDEQHSEVEEILSVYVLRGFDREEQTLQDNRFVLNKQDTVIYAARLEVASGALNISQDDLIKNFLLIRQEWKAGEM